MARKKSHTKKAFGAKKVRRALIDNIRKRSVTQPNVESVAAAASADAADTDLGLTSPSSCGGADGRVRCDTKFLQPAELEEGRKRAQDKLLQLSSTPATERKRDLLTDNADAACETPDTSVFTIVSLDLVNTLLVHAKCKLCSAGDLEIVRDDREYGLAVKLRLMCTNCSDVTWTWSSPRVRGEPKANPFSVNVLAARAMQATGNRQTAFNDIFSLMNISRRGLHTKTWQSYLKGKLVPAADRRAAKNVTSECALGSRALSRFVPQQPRKHRGVVRWVVDDSRTFLAHRRRHRDRTVHGALFGLRCPEQFLRGMRDGPKGRRSVFRKLEERPQVSEEH